MMKQLLLAVIYLVIHSYQSSALSFLRHKFRYHPSTLDNDTSYQWFEQKLDHFTPLANKTWKQRYVEEPKFFQNKTGSPVFIMIGGEDYIDPNVGGSDTWISYAKKYGALCFVLEHRYYGESLPTGDVLSTENLRYLSSEQALADIAYFIEGMNRKYGLNRSNKWIAFGGSYAGSLAAWSRVKYPHLVHGAVSNSGPLLAKVDFFECFEVVRSSLDTYRKGCSKIINEVTHELQALLKRPDGPAQILKLIGQCPLNVHNEKDVETFFTLLADTIAGAVQYNEDLGPTIDDICRILTNESIGNPLKRYAESLHAIWNSSYFPYGNVTVDYNSSIQDYKNTTITDDSCDRLWLYQTCTEFGFYATSVKNSSLFGATIPLKYYQDICTDVFGPEFNPTQLDAAVYRTNTIYGGLNIDVTRVVFIHGSLDPWHALGIIKSSNPNAPAIYIKGVAHCAFMDCDVTDPRFKEARIEVDNLIRQWLKE